MKKVILFIGIIFVIILGGCSSEDSDKVNSNDFNKVEESNESLDKTINNDIDKDLEEVIGNNFDEIGEFYTANKSDIVGEDNFKGSAPDQLTSEESDYSVNMEIKGYYTIWEYNSEKDEIIDIKYSISELEGDVSLIYISPDSEMELIESGTTDESRVEKIKVKKGGNRIKVIAKDSARIRLGISLSAGEVKVMEPF